MYTMTMNQSTNCIFPQEWHPVAPPTPPYHPTTVIPRVISTVIYEDTVIRYNIRQHETDELIDRMIKSDNEEIKSLGEKLKREREELKKTKERKQKMDTVKRMIDELGGVKKVMAEIKKDKD